jgi:hypothetical protein
VSGAWLYCLSNTCLFTNIHLRTFPPPFYSKNKLGAAGAKELVKGDWPELRVLKIGWGGLAMLSYLQHRARNAVGLETLSLCHHTLSCSFNKLAAKAVGHLATGCWPKLQELHIK